MKTRSATAAVLLAAMLLLASGCGNNRDFSRGEMKPYIAERAAAPAEAHDGTGAPAR